MSENFRKLFKALIFIYTLLKTSSRCEKSYFKLSLYYKTTNCFKAQIFFFLLKDVSLRVLYGEFLCFNENLRMQLNSFIVNSYEIFDLIELNVRKLYKIH